MKAVSKGPIVAATVAALACAGIVWFLLHGRAQPPIVVRLGSTLAPYSCAVWLAQTRGFFAAEGLQVEVRDFIAGKQGLAEMMAGGLDYTTAADAPIVLALLEQSQIRVVASIATSTDNTSVVARRDRGIRSPSDLQGHRIGIVRGTTSHYFLDSYLEFYGIPLAQVEHVALNPESLVEALAKGEVDAISAWVPISLHAVEQLGDQAVELRSGTMYRWTWNLVARNREVAGSPVTGALLRALRLASDELLRDPAAAAVELSPRLGMTPARLREEWRRTFFELSLDQSLILNLESQARWAVAAGVVSQQEPPNFLPAITATPLRSVDPTAVTIIDDQGSP
jgi:ABC-type nitrate/sulfonate/bicarbonate transport system substrate-binding protein